MDVIQSTIRYDPPEDGTNMARELLGAFRRHAHRTLLVDAGRRREWTGAKLLDRAGRVATNLISQVGVSPGNVVLTICDHTDNEILLALGIILAGGSLYGSNPQDGYNEEKVLCELVRPDVIAANSGLHQMVLELKKNVVGLEETRIIWIDNPIKSSFLSGSTNGINGTHSIPEVDSNNNCDTTDYYSKLIERDKVILFDDLINGPLNEELVDQVAQKRINAREHILTYMLTSGSTGRPKVVPSTHEELMHGLYSMLSANKYPVGSASANTKNTKISTTINGNRSTNGSSAELLLSSSHAQPVNQREKLLFPISRDSVLSGDLPLDHGAGVNTMFLSLVIGAKFIVMPSYNEDSFWQGVHDYSITSSIASTTFGYKLLHRLKSLIDSGETNKWNLSSFKLLTCAGSKMAYTELVREINQVYDHIFVCQCYGSTEIGFISMLSVSDCRTHLHSVGHLFPGLTAKLVDRETGAIITKEPNQRGELHIWAESKFKGYKCLPADNPDKLVAQCHDEDGFYKTGDQVHFDDEGRLYIHGRFNDTLYLMQDWKILPAELEEVVDEHPLVELSAVIGLPDVDLPGCHAPRAFVKLISTDCKEFRELKCAQLKEKLVDQDYEFIANDIYRFVAERTAEPKHLKGGVRILESLPTVGLLNKIDRKALRLIK